MGRITPSFRRLLLVEVERLRRRFRPALMDPGLQRAFDELVKAWSRESVATMMSNIPKALDAMNLLANVHNEAEIEKLERRVE